MYINYILIFLGIFFVFLLFLYLRIRGMSGDVSSSIISEPQVLEIQVSKNLEASKEAQASPLAAENMFSAIHGMLRDDPDLQEHFSFEIASSGKEGIRFYVAVPLHTQKFIEGQIYAHYPDAQIKVVSDYSRDFSTETNNYEFVSVLLSRESFFPIKSFRDIETDTLSSFTSAIASIGDEDNIWIQMLLRPIADTWQKEGQEYVKAVRGGTLTTGNNSVLSSVFGLIVKEGIQIVSDAFAGALSYKARTFDDPKKLDSKAPEVRLTATQELELRTIENKMSRMGYMVQMRIMSAGPTKEKVESHLRSVLAALKQFSAASFNSFTSVLELSKEESLNNYKERKLEPKKSFILNTEELGTVYHLPTANIETPNISWVYSRKSEPPANLPVEDCNYIGHTTYRNKQLKFGLKNGDDRLRHMYLIGKSGTGKSTLLETMISQDIVAGAGVGVLDPHGETIDRVLDRIPDNRIKDVIYFDPSDSEKPLGLNLLEMSDPSEKNLMASGLVSAIKQHFDYSWGPRLEYLLNYAILTLLEVPGTTMLGITRLMDDPNYQKYILHQIKDPLVIRFWEKEFKEMKGNQKLVTEAIAPIQNKVNRFLASTTIRNILGQKKSTLDLWDAMNSGKIILMNLSKGKIGADNANLLGALLVSRLQFFALQRAKIPYEKRRPFYLYVDEFQNFATGSFEEILSESRKYKLGLYLTHQFTAQLPEQLLKAVFGNVGTIATFSLGAPDAKVLENEFAPYFDSEDIISLERFYVYIKLMIDGMTSHPFSARILVPWEEENFLVPKTPNREAVIQNSRNTYGADREYVENKINKWLETQFDKGMAIAQEHRSQEPLPESQVDSQGESSIQDIS